MPKSKNNHANGFFTRFDNRVLDTWLAILPSPTYKVLSHAIRQTEGWHRRYFITTEDDIAQDTGLSIDFVKRGLGRLVKETIVKVERMKGSKSLKISTKFFMG